MGAVEATKAHKPTADFLASITLATVQSIAQPTAEEQAALDAQAAADHAEHLLQVQADIEYFANLAKQKQEVPKCKPSTSTSITLPVASTALA